MSSGGDIIVESIVGFEAGYVVSIMYARNGTENYTHVDLEK